MAIAKLFDVESIRFSAPDLAQMRGFLLDFGLFDAEDVGDGVLRMRGTGNLPCIHETVKGPAGFVALTLRAQSLADVEALAKSDGVAVVDATGPGGGKMVVLTDPDGFTVEVIADKARTAQMPRGLRGPWNIIDHRDRPNAARRVQAGPAHVARLGHVVLAVSDMTRTWQWYQERFGLLLSDEVRAPTGDVAALFIRCDRGAEPVDHHTLNFASVPGVPPQFHHCAFEVADLDDLMVGNAHLVAGGYRHDWGIGRHILGSQVFDYWRDPWGHRIEHWTDGDLFDASEPVNITDIPTMMSHQWGPPSPPDFVG